MQRQQSFEPAHPGELVKHQCVVVRFPSGRPYHWEFEGPEGKLEIIPSGNIILDDMDSGLEELLPEPEQWQLYYPNRQYMTCGLRAFLDYIKSPLPPI